MTFPSNGSTASDPLPPRTATGRRFLLDVWIASLGAYGGPEAHISVLLDQMVSKGKYLSEAELLELVALCSILPGPTSTQTIVAVGYRTGGPRLALLTMLVWSAPVLVLMSMLSFLYGVLADWQISPEILRFIGPMAVGFIMVAAFRIGRKVVIDPETGILMGFATLATCLVRTPWIFPAVLCLGGITSILSSSEKNIFHKPRLHPPWGYLLLFFLLAGGSLLLAAESHLLLPGLFESFYRYGYLVFGGGQVVVPLMHSELVEMKGYMSNAEFLTGYGLVQGLPGPMFSFAAYAGGMAARGGSILQQLLGAAIGGIGIFLPGLLLIFFVYPVWEEFKQIRAVKISLKGINATAGGMIAAAALILMQANGFSAINLTATALTILLLVSRKVPAPVLVWMAILAGVLM